MRDVLVHITRLTKTLISKKIKPLMGLLAGQFQLFLMAVQRYTCVHAPLWLHADQHDARPAIRYFPLIGLLVGVFSGLIYATAAYWFPPAVAVLLSLIAGLLLTGALHERGLGKMAEHFAEGTASIAAMMVLLLKFATLAYLQNEWIVTALICGHALSRFAALPLVVRLNRTTPYADSRSHMEPKIGPVEFLCAGFYGLLPLMFVVSNHALEPQMRGPLLIGSGAALAMAFVFGMILYRRIGTISDEGLSAVQQLAEAAFYLGLLISPH